MRYGLAGLMVAFLVVAVPAHAFELVIDLPSLERIDQRHLDDNCIPMERTNWRGPAQIGTFRYINLAPRCAQGRKLPVDMGQLAREELNNPSFGEKGPLERRRSRRGWSFDTIRFEASADSGKMGCVWMFSQISRTGLIYGIYCAEGLDEAAIATFLNALGTK
jgi:hypothetical protein